MFLMWRAVDFGLAAETTGATLNDVCGSPGYVGAAMSLSMQFVVMLVVAAPEVLSGTKYGASVDLWAVGVILYILYVLRLW